MRSWERVRGEWDRAVGVSQVIGKGVVVAGARAEGWRPAAPAVEES